jgi:hypothetical protein
MPVELCACARAMDPSRRAYRAPLLQSSTLIGGVNSLTRGPTRVTTLTLTQAVGYNPGRYFSRGLGRRADPGRL